MGKWGGKAAFPAWPRRRSRYPQSAAVLADWKIPARSLAHTTHASFLRTSTDPHRECLEISAAPPPFLLPAPA